MPSLLLLLPLRPPAGPVAYRCQGGRIQRLAGSAATGAPARSQRAGPQRSPHSLRAPHRKHSRGGGNARQVTGRKWRELIQPRQPPNQLHRQPERTVKPHVFVAAYIKAPPPPPSPTLLSSQLTCFRHPVPVQSGAHRPARRRGPEKPHQRPTLVAKQPPGREGEGQVTCKSICDTRSTGQGAAPLPPWDGRTTGEGLAAPE